MISIFSNLLTVIIISYVALMAGDMFQDDIGVPINMTSSYDVRNMTILRGVSDSSRLPGQVVTIILLVSGDVESNPGPDTDNRLMIRLAEIISKAPTTTIKSLLSIWSESKTQDMMVTELEKFKVDNLREGLIWLLNKPSNDKDIKKMKKRLVAVSNVIAIESLLPDTCWSSLQQ